MSKIQQLERQVDKCLKAKNLTAALDGYVKLAEEYEGAKKRLRVYDDAYKLVDRVYVKDDYMVFTNLFLVRRKMVELNCELGRVELARDYLAELINFSTKYKKMEFMQTSYHIAAWMYRSIHEIETALKYAKMSMKLLVDYGSKIDLIMTAQGLDDFADKRKCALNQLTGDIYLDMEYFKKAEYFFLTASRYNKLAEDPELSMTVLMALREVTLFPEERVKMSEKMHKSVRKMHDLSGDSRMQIEVDFLLLSDKLACFSKYSLDEVKSFMIDVYKLLNKKGVSKSITAQGEQILISLFKIIMRNKQIINLRPSNEDYHLQMALLCEKCGDYASISEVKMYRLGVFFYTKMMEAAEVVDHDYLKKGAYLSLAETYSDLGMYNKAYEMYDKLVQLEANMTLSLEDVRQTMLSQLVVNSKRENIPIEARFQRLKDFEWKANTLPLQISYYQEVIAFMKNHREEIDMADFHVYTSGLERVSETEISVDEALPNQPDAVASRPDEIDAHEDEFYLEKIKVKLDYYIEIEDLKSKRNRKDKNGETELHHACKTNNLERVKKLIEECEYDINALDNGGWTPLSEAVDYNEVEIVRYLVQQGADLNIKSREGLESEGVITKGGRTPLIEACDKGNAEMIGIFLNAAADPLILSDANWKAADFLERFLKENASCADRQRLKGYLKALRAFEEESNVKKVTMTKDVLEKKLLIPTKKPDKQLDEDKQNLMEYEDVLHKLQKSRRRHRGHDDLHFAQHVGDENLDDPDFLDDDMRDDPLDDLGDKTVSSSFESAIENSMMSSNGGLQDDIVIDRVISKPIAGAKRSYPSDAAESTPPLKKSHLGTSLVKSASKLSVNSVDSSKTRSSADSRSTVRGGNIGSTSSSTLDVNACIVDGLTGLEITTLPPFKVATTSTMADVINTHVCGECENFKLGDFNEVVPEKDGERLWMGATFASLLPSGVFLRKMKINYVIYDWVPPPSAALFESFGGTPDIQVVLMIDEAQLTKQIDLNKVNNGYLNIVNVLKVIVFKFCRKTSNTVLNKIVMPKLSWSPEVEKAAAIWLNHILDVVSVFDALKCPISTNLLQMLTSTTRDNIRELHFSSCNFSLDTLNRFLSKSMNLEVLVLQNISPVDGVTAVNDIVNTICHMRELRQLNLSYWKCIEDKHVDMILKSCRKLSHLNISETGVKFLHTYLCSDLEHLNIAGTGVDVDEKFCDSLSKIENLTYINLSSTNFSFVYLETLAGVKKKLDVKAFGVDFGFPTNKLFGYAVERIKKQCDLKVYMSLARSRTLVKELAWLSSVLST